MRELKFRMPIMVDKKFSHWHYWGFINGEFIGPDSRWVNTPSEQFTGLQDKNRVDIYEGDIVEFVGGTTNLLGCSYPSKMYEVGSILVVQCLESGFALQNIYSFKNNDRMPNLTGNVHNYEMWNHQRSLNVIGNTTENSELLK